MITNKFSFSGAMGKSHNIGGSMGFSIPHTIDVPPEYSLETDVPSVAEFLTSSLNGKLWIFRRSRRFYLAVLRWDVYTQRLVFVTSAILSNENFIRRGVDWILTDKSFILSSNDEPYFSISQYEADHTSYIDAVNQSYSFFPELETWEEIINGQILHVEGSPYDLWNNIPQNKLTPLEFHCYSDDNIQVITNFSPKLCYCNGLLYAKGMAHIGRVFLLPRSFNENGDIEDFYLYISPDYLRIYDNENQTFYDNDGWNDLIIAPFNEKSACFFTPDNEDYGFCKKPVNSQVISLPQLEHLDFSQYNGAIFFDGLTLSNLLLNDSGASLLYDNISYECNSIRQWLAPAGFVKAIEQNLVIASDDSSSIATHLDSGFFREKLHAHTLPLTSSSYSEKRIAMGDDARNNKRILHVHEYVNRKLSPNYANWENIHKQPCFSIKFVDSIIWYESNSLIRDLKSNLRQFATTQFAGDLSEFYQTGEYRGRFDDEVIVDNDVISYLTLSNRVGHYLVFNKYSYFDWDIHEFIHVDYISPPFYCNISQIMQKFDSSNWSDSVIRIYNFYDINDVISAKNGKKIAIKCFHIYEAFYAFLFQSIYHPDIFDFDAELERSKLF